MGLSVRSELILLAYGVANLLNLVEDDDERELLQELFEQTLNDELFTASLRRGQPSLFETAVEMSRADWSVKV
jgi:hypothetical protein